MKQHRAVRAGELQGKVGFAHARLPLDENQAWGRLQCRPFPLAPDQGRVLGNGGAAGRGGDRRLFPPRLARPDSPGQGAGFRQRLEREVAPQHLPAALVLGQGRPPLAQPRVQVHDGAVVGLLQLVLGEQGEVDAQRLPPLAPRLQGLGLPQRRRLAFPRDSRARPLQPLAPHRTLQLQPVQKWPAVQAQRPGPVPPRGPLPELGHVGRHLPGERHVGLPHRQPAGERCVPEAVEFLAQVAPRVPLGQLPQQPGEHPAGRRAAEGQVRGQGEGLARGQGHVLAVHHEAG
ncbi:hypothetical protein DAERI_250002 [Deinococcus aerius]|uniref:Uncharacterized protein n=1 Tax=Deinococcus aerius TaxID=200253 RepID=A0A2I9DY20_9DEIO|nr:hypothetical protein [Deinococcus aerius]GBF08167.1 hypothetical protein DAERI_250002 [Deinococcus aerius]